MINPKKFRWSDTEEKIQTLIREKNIDRLKLEKACELAAYKIYPVYSTFQYEVGNKTPSVHYLHQIIFELVVGELSDLSDTYSWGGITVESCQYGEDDSEDDYFAVNISFDLGSIWFEDVQKKE